MSNSNFKNYVTGGAFQLSLSRRQIDALQFAKRIEKLWVTDGFVGCHSENVLLRKGLLELCPEAEQDETNYQYYKLSKAGELVYQLLDEAGLIIHTPEPVYLESPVVQDFDIQMKTRDSELMGAGQ